MNEYKPNSHKYKEEQRTAADKKVEKVVSGTARIKKKSEIHKFADIFLAEDAANVKSYIFTDVFVPGIQRLISDMLKGGVDMLFGGSRRGDRGTTAGRVSYRSYYDQRNDSPRSSVSSRGRFDYDDIVFESRGEADLVLDRMFELLETYRSVTVADLYDLADITHDNFMAHRYGWTDLRGADAQRVSGGGYILKLPRVKPLD